MERHNNEQLGETSQVLRPIPQFRWVKYLAGKIFKKRLEQLYFDDSGSMVWREIPTILEIDTTS